MSDTPASPSGKRWYVVHAYSGMEKSVQRALQERIERAGMQDQFGQILVPTEEVVEVKGGHKSVTERRFFPGYVLVEMERRNVAPREEHGKGDGFRRRCA
jgi:transcriptional antiterminator NusG